MGKVRVVNIEGYAPKKHPTELAIPIRAADVLEDHLNLSRSTERRAAYAAFFAKNVRVDPAELDGEDPQAVLHAMFYSTAGVIGGLALYKIKEGQFGENHPEVVESLAGFLDAKIHFQEVTAKLREVFSKESPNSILSFLSENMYVAWSKVGNHPALGEERKTRHRRLCGMLRELVVRHGLEGAGLVPTRYGTPTEDFGMTIDLVSTVPAAQSRPAVKVPIQVKAPETSDDEQLATDIKQTPMRVFVPLPSVKNLSLSEVERADLADAVRRKAETD